MPSPPPSPSRAAPVGELASALVRLLNPRSLQSGRSLLGETRQLLHDFLAERHGKLPDISQLAVRRKLDYEMMSAPAAERGGESNTTCTFTSLPVLCYAFTNGIAIVYSRFG